MNSGGTWTSRTIATGSAWIHMPPLDNRGSRGVWPVFFFSSLPRWQWGSRSLVNPRKRNKWQLILVFISFTDLLLFLFFPISDMLLSTYRFFSFAFSFFSVSGGDEFVGVTVVVQALMVFTPIGSFGGCHGRNVGGWSVQRRAGGWGMGRHLWVLLLVAAVEKWR